MKSRRRTPTSPGVLLRKLIAETGLSQAQLAREIGVSFQTINLIVNGKRSISADVALRLAKRFDMTPQFWLNMQNAVDLQLASAAMTAASN